MGTNLIHFTGKVTGYIDLTICKMKTAIFRGSRRVRGVDIVRVGRRSAAVDSGKAEYYQNLGRTLTVLLESDRDSENLTIVDLPRN